MKMREISMDREHHQSTKKTNMSRWYPMNKTPVLGDSKDKKWLKYLSTILNQNEEFQVTEIMLWRQNTSMPIQKATSLQIQISSQFPKKCCLLIQPFMKDFSQLKNLKLNQSLYLLSESLLGFNSLLYRFGAVEVQQRNCGINHGGKCKVWISNQLNQSKPVEALTDINSITRKLFQFIIETTAPRQRKFLQELRDSVFNATVNGFYSIHSEIKKYIEKYQLIIPTSLSFKEHSQNQTASKKISKYFSPIKMSMKNTNSPHSEAIINQKKKFSLQASEKSKKHHYNQNKLNQSIKKNFSPKKYQSLKFTSQQKRKPEKEPFNIEADIKKPQANEGLVREFCVEKNKIFKQYNIMVDPSKQNSNKQTKNSLSTSQGTHSKGDQISKSDRSFHNFPEEVVREINSAGMEYSGKNVVSLMIQSETIKGNYDFGGLLREERLKASTEKSLNPPVSQKIDLINMKSVIQSIFVKENVAKSPNQYSYEILKQNCWEPKFNLLEDEQLNLKESITCGNEIEEKKMEKIDLEKLGKFGREVGKSIIPVNKGL